jgi:hypothetical protein
VRRRGAEEAEAADEDKDDAAKEDAAATEDTDEELELATATPTEHTGHDDSIPHEGRWHHICKQWK